MRVLITGNRGYQYILTRLFRQAGLLSPQAVVLPRCQIILASARGKHALTIGHNLGCDDQAVRNVIKALNRAGLA